MRMLRTLCSFSLLLGIAATGVVHAHTRVQPGFNLFSAQQDVEIGTQSAAAVERQYPILSTPTTAGLVARVGARLAAHAPGAKYPYRFKVVNLSDLNAFALPGGPVYVHRGLIEKVRSEGELAGVLAHEIAHVALRHATHNASKAYVAKAGVGVVERFLSGRSGKTSSVLNTVGGVGLNTLFLRFSRSAEEEADAVGAQIMAKAGYDPMDMASFFQFMRQQASSNPSKVAVFFSSHPSPANREAHIKSEARTYAVRQISPIGGLRAAQAELRNLAPAPSARSLAAR